MGEIINYADADLLTQKVETLIEESRKSVVNQVNSVMVQTYYEIGRAIVENEQNGEIRASYGKGVLKELSKRLNAKFGKGFSVDNLENMRRFYLTYSNIKSETLFRKSDKINQTKFILSWSHYLFLIHIDNPDERKFYEIEAIKEHWSLRELKRQFDSALYERLALSTEKDKVLELSKKGQIVLYNRLLRCFVLVDLKIGKLKHQDLGQMQMYVNYYDRYEKADDENPTIGILLCNDKNDSMVELTLPKDSNIYASKYELYLPDKKLLQEKLIEWIEEESGNA